MFTGIITHLARIHSIEISPKKDYLLSISLPKNEVQRQLEIGCSIASNGICLTLIEKRSIDDLLFLDFFVSEETWQRTTLKDWSAGMLVNSEFSLRVGDELGGHFVLGHVDAVGKIQHISQIRNSWQFDFQAPDSLLKFIAAKGSITINGVALTVNSVQKEIFSVNIIDHTYNHTTFKTAKIGDGVNLEIDPLARYVQVALTS